MTIKRKKAVPIPIGDATRSTPTEPIAPGEPGSVLSMPSTIGTVNVRVKDPAMFKRTIRAWQAMVMARGWDSSKLIKWLGKRGVFSISQFYDDGLELTLFPPVEYNIKRETHRVLILLKLSPDADYFDARIFVQVHTETHMLHEPIRVPVVDTIKAQTDAVMRAYHALYDGVCCVVGAENLPGWPGDEGIADMNRRVSLRARQCLNRMNTLPGGLEGDEY